MAVENRPGGAGGTVGAAVVANAELDGYALLASAPSPLVTAAALYKSLGYEPRSSAERMIFEKRDRLADLADYFFSRVTPGDVLVVIPNSVQVGKRLRRPDDRLVTLCHVVRSRRG